MLDRRTNGSTSDNRPRRPAAGAGSEISRRRAGARTYDSGGRRGAYLMRLAFILDPLDSLKAYKDSSIAMMRAAQAAGHAVWAIQQPAIHWTHLHGVCAEAVHMELLDDDA